MDVGLVQAIRFLPSRPERLVDTYRNFVNEAVLAEDLRLDFVWTTEHHFAFDGWMPAQLPILAFIAARPFPLWVGGFGPKLLLRAGREGYHLQGGREGIQTYLDGLEEGGYDERDLNYQIFYPGHVGATRDRAWDEAQEGIYHYRDFYTYG